MIKVSRRKVLELGASSGLLAVAGSWGLLNASTRARIMTEIPSTGERLPSVGLGTRDYRSTANVEDMQRFRETLQAFYASGGRVIDTSPNYGEAETVIGGLLRELELTREAFGCRLTT